MILNYFFILKEKKVQKTSEKGHKGQWTFETKFFRKFKIRFDLFLQFFLKKKKLYFSICWNHQKIPKFMARARNRQRFPCVINDAGGATTHSFLDASHEHPQ